MHYEDSVFPGIFVRNPRCLVCAKVLTLRVSHSQKALINVCPLLLVWYYLHHYHYLAVITPYWYEKVHILSLFMYFLYYCTQPTSKSLIPSEWQAICWLSKGNKIIFGPVELSNPVVATGGFTPWPSAQMSPCLCLLCGQTFSDAICSSWRPWRPIGFCTPVVGAQRCGPRDEEKACVYVSLRTERLSRVRYPSNMEGGLEVWLQVRKP